MFETMLIKLQALVVSKSIKVLLPLD